MRDRQIVLATLPLLSGLLSPKARLHLDLEWGVFPLEHLAHVLMP